MINRTFSEHSMITVATGVTERAVAPDAAGGAAVFVANSAVRTLLAVIRS